MQVPAWSATNWLIIVARIMRSIWLRLQQRNKPAPSLTLGSHQRHFDNEIRRLLPKLKCCNSPCPLQSLRTSLNRERCFLCTCEEGISAPPILPSPFLSLPASSGPAGAAGMTKRASERAPETRIGNVTFRTVHRCRASLDLD